MIFFVGQVVTTSKFADGDDMDPTATGNTADISTFELETVAGIQGTQEHFCNGMCTYMFLEYLKINFYNGHFTKKSTVKVKLDWNGRLRSLVSKLHYLVKNDILLSTLDD